MRILLVFLFLVSVNWSFSAQTVLDYYQSLKKSGGGYIYQMFQSNNQVWALSEETEQILPVKADLANGYLTLFDEGTGGGGVYATYALFYDAAKNPTLAETVYLDNGIGGMRELYRLRIYTLSGGVFQEVSAKSFPAFNYKTFVSDTLQQKYKTLESVLTNLHYRVTLPQYGTTVTITLQEIDNKFQIDKLGENEKKLLKEFIGKFAGFSAGVNFNKTKAVFEFAPIKKIQ